MQTAQSFHTIQPLLFWLIAGITGLCAIATVVTQNIVRAATWLLFTLAGTSALFFLLGADLVGATQLLVYVGGTLVLVVFGVMLTAQGPFISMRASGAEWAISIVAGLLLMGVLSTGIMSGGMRVGPPSIRSVEFDPVMGQKRAIHIVPEVTRYAPKRSRAERDAEALKPGRNERSAPPEGKGTMPFGMTGIPKKDPGPGKGGPDQGPDKPAQGKGLGGGKKGGGPGGGPGGKKGGGAGALKPPDFPWQPIPDDEPAEALDPATSPQSTILGEGFLGVPVGPAHPSNFERAVRTSYLLPFEIVSVHLLVVLIGAAYLARAKRRRGAPS